MIEGMMATVGVEGAKTMLGTNRLTSTTNAANPNTIFLFTLFTSFFYTKALDI
jgi:hypothetical protein